MVKAMPAYERETNLEFAEQAIVGNLKQLEGLLEVSPDNQDLLLLTSRSFASYAFGFVEEKIDIANKQYDFEKKEELVMQAVDFYTRARKHGLALLAQHRKSFPMVLDRNLEYLSSELKFIEKKHVPALFWTVFAWGNIINLQQDDPERLAELPKVDLIMENIIKLDERYFFGGPHLFYGVYYGGRPETLGGDPEMAKKHFLRAIDISQGKYLMTRFLLAKYYAVRVQDRTLFEQTLKEIISAPADIFPEQGLVNQLAKRHAVRWLDYADDIFF